MNDPTPHSRLAAWIALHSMSQIEAADRIGISRDHVSRIINGLTPSILVRKAIELATGGEIKEKDWA